MVPTASSRLASPRRELRVQPGDDLAIGRPGVAAVDEVRARAGFLMLGLAGAVRTVLGPAQHRLEGHGGHREEQFAGVRAAARGADGQCRDDANRHQGMRDDLPALSPSEYYWDDLIGLAILNLQDQALGRVISLIETGAHDVLVVRDAERERLLPFVNAIVKSVDIPGGVIRVDWGSDW